MARDPSSRPGPAQRRAGGRGERGKGEEIPQGRWDAPIFSLEKKAKLQHTQHATQIFVFILKRARVAGLGPEAHAWLSLAGSEGASPVPTCPTRHSFLATPILPLPEAPRVPTHQASAVPYMELARRLPTSRLAQATGQTPCPSPKKSWPPKNPSSVEVSAGVPVPTGWRC